MNYFVLFFQIFPCYAYPRLAKEFNDLISKHVFDNNEEEEEEEENIKESKEIKKEATSEKTAAPKKPEDGKLIVGEQKSSGKSDTCRKNINFSLRWCER